jgi:hypothetical protein
MADTDPGTQANSRIANIKRFLAKPAEGAVLLKLFVNVKNAAGDPTLLHERSAIGLTPDMATAEDIDSFIKDEIEAKDQHELEFALVWVNAEARHIGQRNIKARRPAVDYMNQQSSQVFNGSADSLVIQAQRLLEAERRISVSERQTVMMTMSGMLEGAYSRLIELESKLTQAREESYALRLRDVEARERALEEGGGAELPEDGEQPSPATEKLVSLLEKLAPIAMMRWAGNQQASGTPEGTGNGDG